MIPPMVGTQMPLMQQALLTSSHLLAEQVCQAYTSGRVSTQLAGLLQQLCPSASLCSIALYHEGGKLASVSNLLTAGLAKFSVAPLTSMAAGLAVLQRRWFHASCPSSRPSKYRDLHQAAGKHGCESVVCVPIPVPAAAAPAMGAAHSMGVLTLGVTKSDAVEIRHLSSLLLLAQSLAPHLAAKALPLLHDIGAHLRRPLLRHVRRGPTYNVVDMSGKGAAGPALELLPAAAAQISQQRSEDCCPRQTDANDALEPMVSAPELGSPKADHGMPDGWAKKSPPGSPMCTTSSSNSTSSTQDYCARLSPARTSKLVLSPAQGSQLALSPRSAFTLWQPSHVQLPARPAAVLKRKVQAELSMSVDGSAKCQCM